MRVIKNVCVCVFVKFKREKLHYKSQIQPLCAAAVFCWHLMGKIWYCTQTKSYRKLFLISTSNLEHNMFRFMAFDFLAGL